MDSNRFDTFTRTFRSRRDITRTLAGTAAGQLGFAHGYDAASAPCPKNKKRCGKKCIPKRRCCTSAQCKPRKSGKVCKKGRCVCPGGMKRCGNRCLLKAAACPPKPDVSCSPAGIMGLNGVGRRYAQTFTEPNGGRLIAVEIRIRNQSASTIGFYDLRLHTVDPASGMPQFTTLAVANRLADHISDTTAEWVRFNFPVPQRLQPGRQYALVMILIGGTGGWLVDYNPSVPCPGGTMFVPGIVGELNPIAGAGMAYRTFVKP